jgi:hypothetical protein
MIWFLFCLFNNYFELLFRFKGGIVMSLLKTVTETRKYNYDYGIKTKCLNCGKEINGGNNIYSRRFCSETCKVNYLL